MDQDKIIAAILTNSLAVEGKFTSVGDVMAAYQAVLKELTQDKPSSKPIVIGQDEGLADGHETALRNLHF